MPARSQSGYRLYSPDDADRVRFIKTARQLRFTLGEVKEILALRDNGQAPCAYVSELVDRRRAELDQTIADLRALREELDRLSADAKRLPRRDAPVAYCHILEHATTPGASA